MFDNFHDAYYKNLSNSIITIHINNNDLIRHLLYYDTFK